VVGEEVRVLVDGELSAEVEEDRVALRDDRVAVDHVREVYVGVASHERRLVLCKPLLLQVAGISLVVEGLATEAEQHPARSAEATYLVVAQRAWLRHGCQGEE